MHWNLLLKLDGVCCRFTCSRGFYAMVKEVNDFAGQHEVICENLTNTVLRELQSSIQENKQERKRVT